MSVEQGPYSGRRKCDPFVYANPQNFPQRGIRVNWSKYEGIFKDLSLGSFINYQCPDTPAPRNENNAMEILDILIDKNEGCDTETQDEYNVKIPRLPEISFSNPYLLDPQYEKFNLSEPCLMAVMDTGSKPILLGWNLCKVSKARHQITVKRENELLNHMKQAMCVDATGRESQVVNQELLLGFPPIPTEAELEHTICIWEKLRKDSFDNVIDDVYLNLTYYDQLSSYDFFYINNICNNKSSRYWCKKYSTAAIRQSRTCVSNNADYYWIEPAEAVDDDVISKTFRNSLFAYQKVKNSLVPIRQNLLNHLIEENFLKTPIHRGENINKILNRNLCSFTWRRLINAFVRNLIDHIQPFQFKNLYAKDKEESPQHASSDSKLETSSAIDNNVLVKSDPNCEDKSVETVKEDKISLNDSIQGNSFQSNSCAICFGESLNCMDPMVCCARCWIYIHKNCYGIVVSRNSDDNEQSEYFCDRCKFEKRVLGTEWMNSFVRGSVICTICGQYGGAFKRTTVNGEWVHIFCVLWFIPQAYCEDSISLDVWNLSALGASTSTSTSTEGVCNSTERQLSQVDIITTFKNKRCEICGISWGLCVKCSKNDCNVQYHPLCAWMHGLYVKSSTSVDKFTKWSGKIDAAFPSINIDSYCELHEPIRLNGTTREIQSDIRKRKCSNRDLNPDLSPEKQKRRKKRIQNRGRDSSNAALAPAQNVYLQTQDMTLKGEVFVHKQDKYRKGVCTVCLMTDFNNPNNIMFRCRICNIDVHRYCYGIKSDDPNSNFNGKDNCIEGIYYFSCDVCASGLSADRICCKLCPRQGGAYKRGTAHDTNKPLTKEIHFAHMTCCLWCPIVQFADNEVFSPVRGIDRAYSLYQNKRNSVNFQQSTNSLITGQDYRKSNRCEVCGISFGYLVQCSQSGCIKVMHPLCALQMGNYLELSSQSSPRSNSEAYCAEHSNIRNRINPSLRLIFRLSSLFEMAHLLLSQMKQTEKFKQEWLKRRREMMMRSKSPNDIVVGVDMEGLKSAELKDDQIHIEKTSAEFDENEMSAEWKGKRRKVTGDLGDKFGPQGFESLPEIIRISDWKS